MQGACHKCVLVVEDEPEILLLLRRALEPIYMVLTAEDGVQGFERATSGRPPALIITDIMMPEQDGLRMIGRLRTEKGMTDVPVIFLTARDGPADIMAGLAVGATHYVTKPFNKAELLEKVRALVEAAHDGSE